MPDTLVLDANVFNARGFALFLRSYRGRKVLPAVAAAELYHRAAQRGTRPETFLANLNAVGVTIESLDASKAMMAGGLADATFRVSKAHWLIGAHALQPGRVLVTSNLRDYPHVARKVSPEELMAVTG